MKLRSAFSIESTRMEAYLGFDPLNNGFLLHMKKAPKPET